MVGVRSLPREVVQGLQTLQEAEMEEVCRRAELLLQGEVGEQVEEKSRQVVFTLASLVSGGGGGGAGAGGEQAGGGAEKPRGAWGAR